MIITDVKSSKIHSAVWMAVTGKEEKKSGKGIDDNVKKIKNSKSRRL